MLAALMLLPLALGAERCPSMLDPAVDAALACFVDETPACPPDRGLCVGLDLHVVVTDQGPVQAPSWLAEGLDHANWLFAPVDVGFQVRSVDRVDPSFARVATRAQRDAIGRDRFTRGVVHLFMVARLDDVDAVGEQIRGVHWRQRSNTEKRWVIVSAIGSKVVLGHELGHFFGLPHSGYRRSVMNKRPREQPPWDERVFVADERQIVTQRRDEMRASGMLRAQPRATRPEPRTSDHGD